MKGMIFMPLDGFAVCHLHRELSEALVGGKINKIYQPEKDELVLNITNQKSKHYLLISANNNHPRIHFVESTKENPDSPPMFCMLLRKKLTGGIIANIRQIEFDRIIELTIISKDELLDVTQKKLVIEIMGRHSNIILIENDIITDSIKRINRFVSSYREVLPGKDYIYPPMNKADFNSLSIDDFNARLKLLPEQKIEKAIMDSFQGVSKLISREICHRIGIDTSSKVSELDEKSLDLIKKSMENMKAHPKYSIYKDPDSHEIKDFSTVDITFLNDMEIIPYQKISPMLEDYYLLKDSHQRIKERTAAINQIITNKLERNYNKLNKLIEDKKNAEDSDKYRLYADILYANLYSLKKPVKEAVLENYNDGSQISIPLDIRKTPAENAKKYYEKYNKAKRALTYIEDQTQKTKEEIYYLESILDSISKCDSVGELREIKDELSEYGLIKSYKKNKKISNNELSSPEMFRSSEGFTIMVGKNNKQNDTLTTKTASKDDLWFHVKDQPGSHVVVKTSGKTPGSNTINEAAMLAAYFSKGKMSSNVAVDYTLVKYVKKPKSAKAGMVIYTDNKTVYVTPKDNEVAKLRDIQST
ncbi:MAG TPA: fibronectin/fibrinogen-binding protein [Eubacteriaceae bacterium]|jgi:predicted ribosome quality control (RQC) complex YloA/Tae2 family protein|nr:fibronectin/fibrinogen-binding protein [Eubacteriaceae bacterium]